MEKINYIIEAAIPEDAPVIGKAVVMAVGSEIAEAFAGEQHSVADVERMFSHLASLPDSQYSYRNALVALVPGEQRKVAGVLVMYPGARLAILRKRFFEGAKKFLDKDIDRLPDETSPDEYYLDSLAVMPEYQGRGIGSELLKAGMRRAHQAGLPAGLLVDPDNPKAMELYLGLGFKMDGMRPFADTQMHHLIFPQ